MINRRAMMVSAGTAAAAAILPVMSRAVLAANPATRVIPSSGERIPAIGLGSWITFNVGRDPVLLDQSAAVITAFAQAGGGMIDSSPMYGSAQTTIGHSLKRLGRPKTVFSADKVWVSNGARGPAQIEQSRKFWGIERFDLLQVHNLVAWRPHLETLFEMKSQGTLRYAGITTSHGRRHGDLEAVMAKHPVDFVQLTYNIADREAESRLLRLARERGIAVIANRPFRRGSLLRSLERHPLPGFANEIGAKNWAQFALKFIISHPAITCAIPATTRVDHVRENVASASGTLPDAAMRARMAAHVQGL